MCPYRLSRFNATRGFSPRNPGSEGRYTAAPLHPPRVGGKPPIPQSRLTHPLSAGLFGFSPTIFPALTECGGYQNGFQTPEEKVYAGSAQKKEAGDMPPPLYAIN